MTDTWEPANPLEHQMRDALVAGDQDAYFRLLTAAELLVPLPQGETNAAPPSFTWPTSTHEGRTHVLVYTSAEAARACLGPVYEHFARMSLADVARSWPDPEWWLAVNSGLPIEGYLPAWFIDRLTGGETPAQNSLPGGREAPPRRGPHGTQGDPSAPREPGAHGAPDGHQEPGAPAGPGAQQGPGAQHGPGTHGGALEAQGGPGAPDAPAAQYGSEGPAGPGARSGGAPGHGDPATQNGLAAPGGFPPPDGRTDGFLPAPDGFTSSNGSHPRNGHAPPNGFPPPGGPAGHGTDTAHGAVAPTVTQDAVPPAGTPEDGPPHATGEAASPFAAGDTFPPIAARDAAPPSATGDAAPPSAGPGGRPAPVAEPGMPPEDEGAPPTIAQEAVPPAGPYDDDLDAAPPTTIEPAVPAVAPDGPPRPVVDQTAPHGGADAPREPHAAPGDPRAPMREAGTAAPGPDETAPVTLHLREGAEFAPLDEEERVLHEVATRGDRAGFLRILMDVRQIWVPMVDDGDVMLGPGRPGFEWFTEERDGRTVVPLFTGPSRMREALGGRSFVLSDLAKVLRFWPDSGWDLIVNGGTPIGATIPGDQVVALSRQVDAGAAARLERDFAAESDAERRLFETRDDRDAAGDILLDTSVFLPVWSRTPPTVQTPPADPAFPWSAVPVRGRMSVLVFTSFDWMKEAVGTTAFVMPSFADLVAAWPTADWSVSVNPGTPIEATLTGGEIAALARRLGDRPGGPASPADGRNADVGGPSAQVGGPVAHVGGTGPQPGGAPPLPPAPATDQAAFRAAEAGAETPSGAEAAGTGRSARTAAETAAETAAAGAPGLPAAPPAGRTTATADTASGPAADTADRPAQAPSGGARPAELWTILQKVLPHDQVAWYLDKAYDRVAGFVHRAKDVLDLETPRHLYETLGLLGDGSPFAADDAEVYIIRWPAYRSGLYRTPFGGSTEDALKEWGEDGWVVEEPPFAGDGFAPGSAGSIPEYKAASVRLPHGSEMYVIRSDGSQRFAARYDADRQVWEDTK